MGDEDETRPQRRCRTCKGGWIVLLTSRSVCPDCEGSGIIAGNFDSEEEGLEFDDEATPPCGTKTPRS